MVKYDGKSAAKREEETPRDDFRACLSRLVCLGSGDFLHRATFLIWNAKRSREPDATRKRFRNIGKQLHGPHVLVCRFVSSVCTRYGTVNTRRLSGCWGCVVCDTGHGTRLAIARRATAADRMVFLLVVSLLLWLCLAAGNLSPRAPLSGRLPA